LHARYAVRSALHWQHTVHESFALRELLAAEGIAHDDFA
jgi:hypothetical protein